MKIVSDGVDRSDLRCIIIVDAALCSVMLDEELAKLREAAADGGRYDDAANLFRQLVEAPTFPEFLTLPAYDLITGNLA